ncbi:MAG: hypothetical protein U0572_15775 [Phycisphaerales bacterium]
MEDAIPIVVGALVAAATICLLLAVVGRADASMPRCRRCKRDARPYAWREPRRCDCGADLSASNAVRATRRRGRRALIVGGAFVVVATLLAMHDLALRRHGYQWRDYLPASAFAALLHSDPGDENIRSLGARIERGLSSEEATTLLRGLGSGGPWRGMAGAIGLDSVLRAIVFAAPPCELDPAALAAVTNGPVIAVTRVPRTSKALLLIDPQPRMGGYLVRLHSVESAGVPLQFEVRDGIGRRYADWFPARPGVVIDVSGLPATTGGPDAQPPAITVSAEIAWWRQGIDVDLMTVRGEADASDGAPITIDPAKAPRPPFTGRCTVSAPTAPTATGREDAISGFTTLRRRAADAGARMTAQDLVGDVAGAIVGTAIMFGCLWFGVNAGRGWHGLEPPRCARCSALLRGADDTLPERCSECGSDIQGGAGARWIQRRRSMASLVLTVPVAVVGGLLLGFFFGGVAGHLAALATRARQGDEVEALIDLWERGGEDGLIAAAQLPAVLSNGPIGERRAEILVRRGLPIAERRLNEDLRNFALWVAPDRDLLLTMYSSLLGAGEQYRDAARRIAELMMRWSSVSVPPRVLVGASIPIVIGGPWAQVVVCRVAAEGSEPRWCVSGTSASLAGFGSPGRHDLTIDVYESPPRPNTLTRLSNDGELQDFAASAMRHRQITRTVDVVADPSAILEPIVDPALDPFANDSLRFVVTLVASASDRGASVRIEGEGAELLLGAWELRIDGVAVPMSAASTPGIAMGTPPTDAMPERIELRFSPAPPNAPPRPRWGLERTIELTRVLRTREDGNDVAFYSNR